MIERWLRRIRRGFRPRPGQSFIEAMIAITVIVTSIASALTLVQSSITASRVGGAQIVAANLAREGVEVARSLRDSNWLKSQSFQANLTDASGLKTARPLLDLGTGIWTMSFAPTSLTQENSQLYLTSDGVYVQADAQPSGSRPSPYHRVVDLQLICRSSVSGEEHVVADTGACPASEAPAGLAAVSSVRYQNIGGTYRTASVEERLYDWR